MGDGELTLKKMNDLWEAVAESGGGAPDSIIVSMTDEEFEDAKAKGMNVRRVKL